MTVNGFNTKIQSASLTMQVILVFGLVLVINNTGWIIVDFITIDDVPVVTSISTS
jgi:hypothetical protein